MTAKREHDDLIKVRAEAENELIQVRSEYESLLEQITVLKARITELTALRDDLVYHVCPALKAEYNAKIVSLELELMAANMYLHQMQRTIEILQAQMNQQQEPSLQEAEARARQENRQYEEDLHRKAEEARRSREKWEESGWSKHDRQEQGTEADWGSENKENSSSDQQSGKEENAAQKIKRLYRKIVKRLHPDVCPNPTEHEKDLLNRAMKAFEEGDLDQLECIWDELSGTDAAHEVYEDTPEGREKLKELLEKLKARVLALEQEIEFIKADFPYKLKSFLEDPAAVEEKRRSLQAKIDNVREMCRTLEAYINDLREKMQRG